MIILGARQVGKSTRLVKDLEEYLSKNPEAKAHIVAHNGSSQHRLTEMVSPNYRHRISISGKMKKKVKNFVDEFDFIDPKCLFIDSVSNYYSTLNGKYQSEFFQELLDTQAREQLNYGAVS